MGKKIKGLSLFANVWIAETYLDSIWVDIAIANELDEKRCELYKHFYPNATVLSWDIWNDFVKNHIIEISQKNNVDLIIATPPCQWMSTIWKMDEFDTRNLLIQHWIDVILAIKPKYVLLENIPQQLKTNIIFDNKKVKIPDFIKLALSEYYNFNDNTIINAKDYGVPQNRERSIFLLSRKDQVYTWTFPEKENKIITLKEAIGHLPELDPLIYDISYEEHLKIFPDYEKKKKKALKFSKFHTPPKHVFRQVYSMMHTPSWMSAFKNKSIYRPKKQDWSYTKWFQNTYKRMSWDKPCNTITTYNRTIGSQENVHPWRFIWKNENDDPVYSDPRVLTLYEIILASSLPTDWNIPNNVSENFVRTVIGEWIPPLLIKKIVNELVTNI
jgi:DNA (cytosine-5)-methyltransferase 1